jgi:hypothetical protein
LEYDCGERSIYRNATWSMNHSDKRSFRSNLGP